jgi:hypothetical protein
MPRGSDLTLSDKATLGLFFIQRYRFLTIDQFAREMLLASQTFSAPPVVFLPESYRECAWLPTNDDQTGLRVRHSDRPRMCPRVAVAV